MRRRTRAGGLLLLLMLFASCKQGTFYGALGDQLANTPLSIAPAAGTITDLSSLTFSASGGAPPYVYSIVSGAGTIDSSTGVFTATGAGTVVVRVTDKKKQTSDATLTVTSTGLLTINPSPTINVNVNTAIQFVAVGGTGPYSFSISSTGSGFPTIDPATGLYRSGFTLGTDSVTVTDSTPITPQTKTATVNVTAAATNVDYTIQLVNPPGTGKGGQAVPAGYDFTVINNGVAGGSQPLSWWVYISDSTLNAAGTQILASNVAGALGSTGTVTIPITGTWPVVPIPGGATKNLYMMVAANDDLNSANNVAGPYAVTLSPTYVDYTPVTVQLSAAGQVAGGPLNGQFQIQNLGNANGTQNIAWTAYVAPTLTPAATTFLMSGIAGPVNGLTTSGFIPFTGTWPTAPGNYVLIVSLASPEDTVSANNVGSSAAGYGTSAPHVDYAVSAVTNTGAATAAVLGPLTGSFHLSNGGPDKGTQNVSWAAYASPSGLVDSSAVLVASGVTPPLAASGFTDVSFGGQWPMRYGNYQLVVSVSAPVDLDSNLLDNVVASGSTAAVGFISEAEPNNDAAGLAAGDVQDLSLTLQPGMSVIVNGNLSGAADTDDVFTFNTGSAASVSLYLTWPGSHNVTLNFKKNLPVSVVATTSTLAGSSLSLSWDVDLASTQRWIDIANTGLGTVPSYTLIVTGN